MTILTQNSRMSTVAQLLHAYLAVRSFHVANDQKRSETTLFKNTDEKYASLNESLVSFIHLTCVPCTFDLPLSLK